MVSEFHILGAGIAGLATGYELAKKGAKVVIYERASEVGGLAGGLDWKGLTLDLGPHIYHTPDDDIERYLKVEFAGMWHERGHFAKNLKNGILYDYPIAKDFVDSLPSDLRQRIQAELADRNDDQLASASNYFEYMNALVGPTLQEMFFIQYPEKLWGIPTTALDANWAPKRIQIRETRSAFYQGQWAAVGKNGSLSILKELERKFLTVGGQILFRTEVTEINCELDHVVDFQINGVTRIKTEDSCVINTLPLDVTMQLCGQACHLRYRGVALVYVESKKRCPLGDGVDFLYSDDQGVLFNRVSDQNSFVEPEISGPIYETILCCEVTYSEGDEVARMSDEVLSAVVREGLEKTKILEFSEQGDAIVLRLPRVYPMYKIGFREELSRVQSFLDSKQNLETIGSLAEFAYADLQILFAKAIDLAERLHSRTGRLNRTNKRKALSFTNSINLAGRAVGPGEPVYIIAEIGLNHNGSLANAKKLIDDAVLAGCDAVKLQTYKSNLRVVPSGKTSRYAEKVLGIEDTDYDLLRKNELSDSEMTELFSYAKGRIRLFSAPFDESSVASLEKVGCEFYKIASFDIVNLRLLDAVGHTGKPVILSTGIASMAEIETALYRLRNAGCRQIALLQCTSVYPSDPSLANLRAIETMAKAFSVPVGLSDHIPGTHVALASVAMGATIIEKHFTLARELEGPDHALSLEPEEMTRFVTQVREVESSLGTGVKGPAGNELKAAIRFRKSMYAARNLLAGEKLTSGDIVYLAPCFGLLAEHEDLVVGLRLAHDVAKHEPLTWECFDG